LRSAKNAHHQLGSLPAGGGRSSSVDFDMESHRHLPQLGIKVGPEAAAFQSLATTVLGVNRSRPGPS
jgi:hypothetical protein